MSHTQNELADLFPEHADTIRRLKMDDHHFARLAEAYHEVNRQVHRMETDVEPTGDEVVETAKKTRLKLLDEIRSALAAA